MLANEIEEVAKAAAETAKFGTKALDVSEKMFGFLGKVLREPAEQVSGIIADRLKFFRWQRQVRMADEVNKLLADRGIAETRAVPPKLAIPILEAASIEENNDLQNLWVKLLSNAMDPDFKAEMRFSYIDILKALNPLDVSILSATYKTLKNDKNVDWSKIVDYSFTKDQIVSSLKISEEDYYISIYNLFRVQCMAPAILRGGMRIGNEPITIFKGAEQISLTFLGVKLVEAAIK